MHFNLELLQLYWEEFKDKIRAIIHKYAYLLHEKVDEIFLNILYKTQKGTPIPVDVSDNADFTAIESAIEEFIDANFTPEIEITSHYQGDLPPAYMVMLGVDTPEGPKSIPMYFSVDQWKLIQSLAEIGDKSLTQAILDVAQDRFDDIDWSEGHEEG